MAKKHSGLIDFTGLGGLPSPVGGFAGLLDFIGIPVGRKYVQPPTPAAGPSVSAGSIPVFIPQERPRINAAEEVELVELIMAGVL